MKNKKEISLITFVTKVPDLRSEKVLKLHGSFNNADYILCSNHWKQVIQIELLSFFVALLMSFLGDPVIFFGSAIPPTPIRPTINFPEGMNPPHVGRFTLRVVPSRFLSPIFTDEIFADEIFADEIFASMSGRT